MGKQIVHSYNEILHGNRKNELGIHTTTWVNLRDVMLSKISQTQRITLYMTSFMPKSRRSRTRNSHSHNSGYSCGAGLGEEPSGMLGIFYILVWVEFS